MTVAAALALTACVALSLALGWVPGGLHLVAVAAALAYDAGLKAGPISPLPYLVSFGLLPLVVTTAGGLPPPGSGWSRRPPCSASPRTSRTRSRDSAADAETGVRGLPQRIGPSASLAVAAARSAWPPRHCWRAPRTGARNRSGCSPPAPGCPPSACRWRRGASRRGVFRLTLLAVALVIAGFVAAA